MEFATIAQLPKAASRVLVRLDLNVPLAGQEVADDFRIEAAVPTVRSLLARGLDLTLISHLGRPGGKPEPALSLRPVAAALSRQLGRPVEFLAGVPGDARYRDWRGSAGGSLALAENLRFDPGEEANQMDFAQRLAAGRQAFVQDAFGSLHRAHASTVAIARLLPSSAGPLLQAEVEALDRLLHDGSRPFGLAIGGAKMKDKLPLLRRLLPQVDVVLLGGALANTFLAASGKGVGQSLYEPGQLEVARELLAKWPGVIHLPTSVVVARGAAVEEVGVDAVPEDARIMDIGERTVEAWRPLVLELKRLFWNGPMGLYEQPPFDRGTRGLARLVGAMQGLSVVGGGDSLAAIRRLGLAQAVTHLSTGGGAALAYLQGDVLPGLRALEQG